MKLKYLGAWKVVDEDTGVVHEAVFTEDMEMGTVCDTHDIELAQEVVKMCLKDEGMDTDEESLEILFSTCKKDYYTRKMNKEEGEKWVYWGKKRGKRCVSFHLS